MTDLRLLEREMYAEAETARLLEVAPSTLHHWLEGKTGRTGNVHRPVIRQELKGTGTTVTWAEFVEAGMLGQYRRELKVRLPAGDHLPEPHPWRRGHGLPVPSAMSVVLELAPEFVLAECIALVAEDLRYGLEHGFLKAGAVFDLADHEVRRGGADPVLQDLAVLLRDEVDQVPDVLKALDDPERIHDPREPARKWLYLQLKAAYSR